MRALNSLAAKMSEKWEMLHFPLWERRQALLDNNNYMTKWAAGEHVALIRNSWGVQQLEVTNTAAQVPVTACWLYSETSGSGYWSRKHKLNMSARVCLQQLKHGRQRSGQKLNLCASLLKGLPPPPQWTEALNTSWYHFLFPALWCLDLSKKKQISRVYRAGLPCRETVSSSP